LDDNQDVVVVDNLSNGSQESINRVSAICDKPVIFVKADMLSVEAIKSVFSEHNISAVIHFAGLKAVGESVEQPVRYYQNNVEGTLNLLRVMGEQGVHKLVFSSSATVYGDPESIPVLESFPTGCTNPYGWSKLMVEQILRDLVKSDARWSIGILRYFNPVGAHESGLIGEDPHGIPNNLMPFISQVAVGKREKLKVFGGDYPTPDGTGIRDYIHVEDLASGHLKMLLKINEEAGCFTYNLGTGKGVSVLEMIKAFEVVTGQSIPYEIVERRAGDIAEYWADSMLAQKELGWKAAKTLEDMVQDAWRWQENNPMGYVQS
jgi:UDP-glucose 4-epimerase